MVKEKGVCDLIEAAERLKPEFGSRVTFLLCGRLTPNKSGITREYMHEHCDGEYICWLGERNDVRGAVGEKSYNGFPVLLPRRSSQVVDRGFGDRQAHRHMRFDRLSRCGR